MGGLNLLIGFISWVGVILLGEQLYPLRQDMNDKHHHPQSMPLCLLAAALLTRLPLHLPYPCQDPVATISASMLPKPSPLEVGLPFDAARMLHASSSGLAAAGHPEQHAMSLPAGAVPAQ